MLLEASDAESPDTHLGMVENPDLEGGITVLSIRLSGERPAMISDQNLPQITREYMEDLFNEGYGMTLDRSDPLR